MQTSRQKDYLYPMNTFPQRTVSFTGHRKYHGEAQKELRDTIVELYHRGYTTFMSGMAVGFDMYAAECVLSLRNELEGIRFVAVVPFEGHQLKFSAADKQRFEEILKRADECVTLSQVYHQGVYSVRNDYLVRHADIVVACYDGSAGGTRYTVQRAEKTGREVINISPDAPRQIDLLLF